jgi:hypothetical protein
MKLKKKRVFWENYLGSLRSKPLTPAPLPFLGEGGIINLVMGESKNVNSQLTTNN